MWIVVKCVWQPHSTIYRHGCAQQAKTNAAKASKKNLPCIPTKRPFVLVVDDGKPPPLAEWEAIAQQS